MGSPGGGAENGNVAQNNVQNLDGYFGNKGRLLRSEGDEMQHLERRRGGVLRMKNDSVCDVEDADGGPASRSGLSLGARDAEIGRRRRHWEVRGSKLQRLQRSLREGTLGPRP